MQFKLWIRTENAAFSDGYRNYETARILRIIADRLELGEEFEFYQTLFDFNGNDVGRAAFKPNDEEGALSR